MRFTFVFVLTFLFAFAEAQTLKISGEKDKQFALAELTKKFPSYSLIAKEIWSYAELGYQETKSSSLLQETLKKKKGSLFNQVLPECLMPFSPPMEQVNL